ncbi:MAG TPA: hypothetical protein VK071_05750 [Tissierellales bacterium]|nr:hypothetical protein [Tissierellales bacterium]
MNLFNVKSKSEGDGKLIMYNSIIERRFVDEGVHNITLEIPANEYKSIYDDYDSEIASEILNYHLQYRGDDGRPSNIEIEYEENNIVRISATVNYLGNDHTEYGRY